MQEDSVKKGSLPKAYQRRNFFINPSFQLNFMGFSLILAGVAIGVIFFANSYFFWKLRELGKAMHLPSNHEYFTFINEEIAIMKKVFVVTALMVYINTTTLGLLFSHRIAGPIYRLTQHFKKIARGEPITHCHFRKKDFFRELAEAYNQSIDKNSAQNVVSLKHVKKESKVKKVKPANTAVT